MSVSTPPPPPTDEPARKKIKVLDEITHILVVDIETTGPNVTRHYMPEFGVSFWKIGDTKPLAERHYTLQQPENTEWDAQTLDEFWNNPARGEDKKTPPMAALKQRLLDYPPRHMFSVMQLFVDFAEECDEVAKGKVVVVFDTAEFDSTFLNFYLATWTKVPSLTRLFGSYRSTRDIDSFYYGVGGYLKFWGAEEVALSGMNVKAFPDWVNEFKATHNPLDDANFIGAKASYVLSTVYKTLRMS